MFLKYSHLVSTHNTDSKPTLKYICWATNYALRHLGTYMHSYIPHRENTKQGSEQRAKRLRCLQGAGKAEQIKKRCDTKYGDIHMYGSAMVWTCKNICEYWNFWAILRKGFCLCRNWRERKLVLRCVRSLVHCCCLECSWSICMCLWCNATGIMQPEKWLVARKCLW